MSTLVLALTDGGTTAGTADIVPSAKEGVNVRAKTILKYNGWAHAKLGGKAAAALPGIIGSIVSCRLTFLSKTAEWMSENIGRCLWRIM